MAFPMDQVNGLFGLLTGGAVGDIGEGLPLDWLPLDGDLGSDGIVAAINMVGDLPANVINGVSAGVLGLVDNVALGVLDGLPAIIDAVAAQPIKTLGAVDGLKTELLDTVAGENGLVSQVLDVAGPIRDAALNAVMANAGAVIDMVGNLPAEVLDAAGNLRGEVIGFVGGTLATVNVNTVIEMLPDPMTALVQPLQGFFEGTVSDLVGLAGVTNLLDGLGFLGQLNPFEGLMG